MIYIILLSLLTIVTVKLDSTNQENTTLKYENANFEFENREIPILRRRCKAPKEN